MDWKRLDRVRGNVGPVHLDLVESFASGRIGRRELIRRGAILGLSAPMISAVIAAVGGDLARAAAPATSSAAPTQGGVIRVGQQIPVALDPIGMQDLGSYGLIAQSFEFLATLGARRRHRPGPRRVLGAQRDR